jgi:hypothetical protein
MEKLNNIDKVETYYNPSYSHHGTKNNRIKYNLHGSEILLSGANQVILPTATKCKLTMTKTQENI